MFTEGGGQSEAKCIGVDDLDDGEWAKPTIVKFIKVRGCVAVSECCLVDKDFVVELEG